MMTDRRGKSHHYWRRCEVRLVKPPQHKRACIARVRLLGSEAEDGSMRIWREDGGLYLMHQPRCPRSHQWCGVGEEGDSRVDTHCRLELCQEIDCRGGADKVRSTVGYGRSQAGNMRRQLNHLIEYLQRIEVGGCLGDGDVAPIRGIPHGGLTPARHWLVEHPPSSLAPLARDCLECAERASVETREAEVDGVLVAEEQAIRDLAVERARGEQRRRPLLLWARWCEERLGQRGRLLHRREIGLDTERRSHLVRSLALQELGDLLDGIALHDWSIEELGNAQECKYPERHCPRYGQRGDVRVVVGVGRIDRRGVSRRSSVGLGSFAYGHEGGQYAAVGFWDREIAGDADVLQPAREGRALHGRRSRHMHNDAVSTD
mmetsp:Transcript_84792/g.169378  ORF Transcript_84792/g.169378 Transcript_84792/m.169378 type:complete len:375 (-) Transcript_84792:94-1218(-)